MGNRVLSSVGEQKKSLPFPLRLSSTSSLYLSGLWRQKTFAWLSPEAVTARLASLKETEKRRRRKGALESLFLNIFLLTNEVVPVDGEVEDLCSVAAVLRHHVARAGVPQTQRSV